MVGLMLPVIHAVLMLIRKSPNSEGLHELVAARLGHGFGGVIVCCEWIAAVGSIVTQLQFCIMAFAYPVDKVLDDNRAFLAIAVAGACLLATSILSLGVERAINIIALLCILGSGLPVLLLALGA